MGVEQRPEQQSRVASLPDVATDVQRDLGRWPETAGYPPVTGAGSDTGGDIPEYFKRYLRRIHPEYDQETIEREVEDLITAGASGVKTAKQVIETLEAMKQFDQEMRTKDSEWTDWF